MTSGVLCVYDVEPAADTYAAGIQAASILKGRSPASFGIGDLGGKLLFDYKQLDFFHVDVDSVEKRGTVLFSEGFGTPQKGNHWPSVDVYKGWENANLVFTDPLMSGSYSNASVRSTSTLDGHVWFAAGKNSALKIEGFATDYTGLKLEYEITANGAGNQNIIKVLTDKGDVDVPDMPIVEQNKYQSVTLAIPDGASYIQFTSEESTNTSGYRIDNVSLTGIAK
jgi:hypothetical protein